LARILVAEDEETLRNLVVRALAQDGHEVVAASDGAEALELLVRNQGRFDLLLSDIRMPLMDGVTLARAAAHDNPDLVILLMTAYADQRQRAGLDGVRVGHLLRAHVVVGADVRVGLVLEAAQRVG